MKYLLTSAAALPLGSSPAPELFVPYAPYYYDRYAYSYGPMWKHVPRLRLGKKGLAPRVNLAGVERSGRKARTIHYLVSGSLQQTIGVGLAPALLVLLPFVYGTPAGIGRVSECGFF